MKKWKLARLGMIPAAVLAGMGNVWAAVPTEVTTELGNAKTDGVSVATLVLVAIIAIFAFKFMRKGL